MDAKTRIILLKVLLGISATANVLMILEIKSIYETFNKLMKTQQSTHEMGSVLRTVIEDRNPELLLDQRIEDFLTKYEFESLMEFNEVIDNG